MPSRTQRRNARSRTGTVEPVEQKDLHILRLIDEGTASETGAAFFRALVTSLAQALDSRFAFVSRFCDDNQRVHVLALWNGEALRENFDYPLPGSPCEHVLNGDIVAFNAGIQDLFPEDREALKEMSAESYLAIPLKDRNNQVLGHLAVIDTRPKNWQERDFGILRIFAARSTAEIERQLAEQEMAQANVELARRVQLETLVAETSTRFMSIDSGSIDAEIVRALSAMGRFIGSDRGVVFLFNTDRSSARLSHEWSLQPDQPLCALVPELSRQEVPEVLDHFLRKLPLNSARPELLPPGFDKLNRLLGSAVVTSRIAVPMVSANQTIGFLGFHSLNIERHWPEEDLRLMRLLSEILSGALIRRDTEAALQRAKEMAESASRAKTEFLASMSHELRTPLNGILGYAQLLRRDPTLSNDHLESVSLIESCGEHLLTLIGEVLDLAKIEAGRMDIDVAPVTLDDFLHQVADVARIRATQAGLRFSYETLNALPPVIVTDERKLRQILLNLLGNAVKFTDQGSVRFRVAAEPLAGAGCRLRFEVVDSGIGIETEQTEKIFDPFHQVRQRERPVEGTGLGLAISRKLVLLLGGTLNVTSTPGIGSTFTVSIDVQRGDASARTRHATPAIVGYNGRRRRILVVDDKADNRQIIGRLLKSLDFEVDEAGDGAEAVTLAVHRQPDLIFMDLVMPVMDGFEAIRTLRKDSGDLARVPIIAVSASAYDDTRAQSAAVGCDAFIAKPIRLDEVINALSTHLRLEWTRGLSPTRRSGESATGASQSRLPAQLARELYDLAMQGDVRALTDKLREARSRDASHGDAWTELANLAGNYDMKALRNALRPHAERSE